MVKPILDGKTRWNSMYYMLDRFLKWIQYISLILMSLSDATPILTNINTDEIIEIINLLRPLKAMMTQISGETHFDRRFGDIEHCFYFIGGTTFAGSKIQKIHFQDPIALSAVMSHIRREITVIENKKTVL